MYTRCSLYRSADFSWISVALCLAAVVFVGPLAFVGAGGMALMAFMFTGFHAATQTHTVNFSGDYKVQAFSKGGILSLSSDPFTLRASARIFCDPFKEDEVIEKLAKHIKIVGIEKVKGMMKLDV